MEFKVVVNKRRSIRSYKDKAVSDSQILELIELGHKAPTAGNIQPWEFIIVKNEENKRKITDTTFRGNDFDGDLHQEWMMEAPVFIVFCANRERAYARYKEKALKTLIYLDLSACIENVILGAVDMGLDTCYISGFKEEKLREVLNLPVSHEAVAVLTVGYAKEDGVSRPKLPINDLIYYEKF